MGLRRQRHGQRDRGTGGQSDPPPAPGAVNRVGLLAEAPGPGFRPETVRSACAPTSKQSTRGCGGGPVCAGHRRPRVPSLLGGTALAFQPTSCHRGGLEVSVSQLSPLRGVATGSQNRDREGAGWGSREGSFKKAGTAELAGIPFASSLSPRCCRVNCRCDGRCPAATLDPEVTRHTRTDGGAENRCSLAPGHVQALWLDLPPDFVEAKKKRKIFFGGRGVPLQGAEVSFNYFGL